MFRNSVITFLILFSFILLTSGCGGSDSNESTEPVAVNSEPNTSEPITQEDDEDAVTLDGEWRSETKDGTTMVATITDNQIKMSFDSEDLSSLYWLGTFPESGETATEGMIVTSEADIEALEQSITGSQSKTKDFTYTDGTLDFEFTVLGSTRTVHLKKS